MSGSLLVLGLLSPLLGFVVLRAVGRQNRDLTRYLGPGSIAVSFACFGLAAIVLGGLSASVPLYGWLPSLGDRAAGAAVPAVALHLHFDPLAAVMCLVITGVGFLIHIYSVGYMAEENDADYARFFAHMNLFVFSMLLLVLADNYVFLVIGWAMVGLCSYLLIGFWHERPAAVRAARKAFVMNVVGDVGIVIASFVALRAAGNLDFTGTFAVAAATAGECGKYIPCSLATSQATLELVAFLLVLGAIAKSAQIPLHTWLPDAMEGPTPVSALIHAATMVTAGVYLLARFHPLFMHTPLAAGTAAALGVATALMAALIAGVQTDIKRVLAYSTMSQIGFMFFAVAIGAEVAGIFHLVTHAFFKALLFLSAGNVIHALHGEQDMRKMGGLWRDLPTTSFAFLVGALALAGIPPLAGFFSKDEIVLGGLQLGGAAPWPGLLLAGVAGLTGYYMMRAFFTAFMSQPAALRPEVHELSRVMAAPVLTLAALAALGGLIQFGPWRFLADYLGRVLPEDVPPDAGLARTATLLTLVLALLGIWAAYRRFGRGRGLKAMTMQVIGPLFGRGFFWDDVQEVLVVQPAWRSAMVLNQSIEAGVIGGLIDGSARAALQVGEQVRRAQSGYLRSYALAFAAAVVLSLLAVGVALR